MASKQEQAINEMVRRGSLTKQEGAQRVLAMRRGPVAQEVAPAEEAPLDITQQLNANASPGALTNLVTGNNQETDQIADLPELHLSGLLAGEDPALVAKVTPALITATNPDEIAQIVESNFPNVGRVFTQDAEGNPFPLLVNNANNNATNINRPGLSGFDLLQGGAIGSALFPATRAGSVVKAALGSGATSTAIQGSQAAVGGEFGPTDVILDTALGGAGKFIENTSVRGRKLSQSGDVTDPIVQAGDAAGVPVLTSDVIPPTTFAGRTLSETAEKIPFAGTGPVRAEQQAFRTAAVDRFADKYGQFSYDQIVASLNAKKDKVKTAAGRVIGNTGRNLDAVGEIPLSNTQKAISNAQKEFSKPGVIQSNTALDDLSTLSSAIKDAPQTFTSLKENRTAFRDILEGADKADRSQLPSRAKSLLTKVESAMKKDMDAFARSNLDASEFSKWQKANAVYANEAQTLKRSRLKTVLDKGDITPESVQTMLFSQKPSEVSLLHKSLTAKGRDNAKSAIVSKIVNDLSKRANGFTPNALASELKKYPAQIKTFFKKADRDELEGFRRLLDATRRAQDAPVTTPTGQTLLAVAGIGGAIADAGTTAAAAGSLGFLSRLYESAPVRNVLIRLAAAPPSAFDQALLNAQSVLTASAQAILSAQQESAAAQ